MRRIRGEPLLPRDGVRTKFVRLPVEPDKCICADLERQRDLVKLEAHAEAWGAVGTVATVARPIRPPLRLTATSLDTPGSSIVMPHSRSAISIVRRLWVIMMISP